MRAGDDTELWRLEERFWTGDETYYEERLADPATMVFPPPAGIMNRAETIAAIAAAARWHTVDFKHRQALRPHSDIALLVYRVHAVRDSPEAAYSALCSSTYVRVGGDWRLALHQQTPIPMTGA